MDLQVLFDGMQQRLLADLGVNRAVLEHPVAKGDATEADWHKLLRQLPARYEINRAIIVDSNGNCSDCIDLVIYDRQYCPLLFTHNGQHYIPAESVYAVFEVKQEFSAKNIAYASEKVASVRRLYRTSIPIPFAAGKYPAKPPFRIIGGVLALDSSWSPALGDPFKQSVSLTSDVGQLDLGCCLMHGAFSVTERDNGDKVLTVSQPKTALISFFLDLFQRLQGLGTVPAIDLGAYMRSFAVELNTQLS